MNRDNYNKEIDNGDGYTFTYDIMGRMESVRNAFGFLEEQNEYDTAGRLLREKDALGTLVEYTYDLGGRQKTIATGEQQKQGKISQTYTFDARGNITGITDGEGNETWYELDAWGRITAVCKPDGSTSLNIVLASNGVSGDMINRYVSENTNHSGYHKLYSNAVQRQADTVAKNMNARKDELKLLGYKGEKLDNIIKKRVTNCNK